MNKTIGMVAAAAMAVAISGCGAAVSDTKTDHPAPSPVAATPTTPPARTYAQDPTSFGDPGFWATPSPHHHAHHGSPVGGRIAR